jgi:hypothetical protein
VVDASVAVEWLVSEVHSDKACALARSRAKALEKNGGARWDNGKQVPVHCGDEALEVHQVWADLAM